MKRTEEVKQYAYAPKKREVARAAGAPKVDAKGLAAKLAKELEGEVRFDDGARGLYAVDASNYRQVPIGVVVPRSVEDVIRTVELCRQYDAPVLSRGGGTSLGGQCCNVAVVIDWTKYLNKVTSLDAKRRTARVLPGCVLDDLRSHAVKNAGLTFGPDPATHTHCTLGGMLGNNSCGVHALWAGRTADNVHSLDVLTYRGERMTVGPTPDEELERIIRAGGKKGLLYAKMRALRDRYADLIRARYPRIPRRVSGYSLDELLPENGFNVARALVGSEGTLVTILEAELRLLPEPGARALAVLGYPSVYEAGDDVPQILEHGPIGLEGVDQELVRYMRMKGQSLKRIDKLPEGDSWLFVEFAGDTKEEAQERAEQMIRARSGRTNPSHAKVFTDAEQMAEMWEIRESGLGATARVPQGTETLETYPGFEDAAVPPDRVGEYLRDFQTLMQKYGYQAALYGHFGDGCIHCRLNFDVKTTDGVRRYRTFVHEAADLVVKYGGSISGEHGDGQARAELLPKMYGPELTQAMQEFKSLWDPDNRMNPGKVVDAYRIDENLRFGGDYAPAQPKTHFQFPEDKFSLANATERCVGVGKCRREEGGTMCPSYMVTREEMHSTRGRAHLLHEMLTGDLVKDGWKSEAVHEALDLCLACKGCKSDCPVNVDMATYKAEFLAHYYEGKRRPRHAYAFGLIMHAARLAGRMPGVANLVTQTRGLRAVAKWAAGMPAQREIPTFGAPSLQKRARRRHARNEGAPRVILYPDTFNNWFHPETGESALEVLEAAGFFVEVPQGFTCCGRPLYDYGMLDYAKRLLGKVLDDFREDIRQGTPFIVLEPSCAATFRDELPNLFPHDMDATRFVGQVFTLTEFLEKKAPSFALPKLARKAVVHGHCHQKAVLDFDANKKIFKKMGMQVEVPDSGCCGMAGSFGFEKDKYDVSVACGERVLLPAVRDAGGDELVVTDGFSCRTQIAQGTGRRALHSAEVLHMGLWQGPLGPADGAPEAFSAGNGAKEAMTAAKKRLALGFASVGSLALLRAAPTLVRRLLPPKRKQRWWALAFARG